MGPIALTIAIMACSTLEDRQKEIVSSYLRENTGLTSEVRAAIERGKVIPGMTLDEVVIAGGVKAEDYRNYSIWVVKNGKLQFPPYVGGRIGAVVIENRSQFNTRSPEPFVVWLKEPKFDTVLRVERGVLE